MPLYGGDAEADYDVIVRLVDGRRVLLSEPARSLIVLKPTEFVEHGACCQRPDLHARSYGEDVSKGALFPDYLLSTDRTDIPLKRANDDLRGAQLLSPPP